MIKHIEIEALFELKELSIPIIDVRSEGEYKQGHIANAINLPLFINEHRALVGICYKQEGREAAIQLGLELIGPMLGKFALFVQQEIASNEVVLHCWRGGMRSSSMAWLFALLGKKVYVLKGGYKSFRKYVLNYLNEVQLRIILLGGRTGSGKTKILRELQLLGKQILDLEALADHKGSAFGWIGRKNEIHTEQFENNIFNELIKLQLDRVIWIENESRGIGLAQIPENIFLQMKNARVYHLEIKLNDRLDQLVLNYEKDNLDELVICFEKIRKRLGHEKTDKAIELLHNNEYKAAAEIALNYYDKTYDYGISIRDQNTVQVVKIDDFDTQKIAKQLISLMRDE
ncbi:MAG: tRNA 2-selenouridine(34) synthase MnmH [Saprospiraceae bacterium]